MERIEKYKKLSRKIIEQVYEMNLGADDDIRNQIIIDEDTNNFMLIMNGWKGESRFYGILIHLEVTRNGKIWVHQDNTDLIIVDQLLEGDIPKKDIIIGFHAPIMRPDTDFATA
jgi:hypothetical protein